MNNSAGDTLSPLASKALAGKLTAGANDAPGRRTSRPVHTELHALLVKACPPDKEGPGSIKTTLAPALGISFQYIYRWIDADKLPPKFVKPLLKAAAGRVTQDELLPFVI